MVSAVTGCLEGLLGSPNIMNIECALIARWNCVYLLTSLTHALGVATVHNGSHEVLYVVTTNSVWVLLFTYIRNAFRIMLEQYYSSLPLTSL